MLYSEFLEGTNKEPNIYNFNEYERINKLYSESETMTKLEAYQLYREPDELTKRLLDEIKRTSDINFNLSWDNRKLKKEIDVLEEKLRSSEAVKTSLQITLEQCLTESKQLANRISNLIYG